MKQLPCQPFCGDVRQPCGRPRFRQSRRAKTGESGHAYSNRGSERERERETDTFRVSTLVLMAALGAVVLPWAGLAQGGELQWEASTAMGTARTTPGVTVGSDGAIYAIGGEGTNPKYAVATAEKWLKGDASWQPIASMSVLRTLTAAVTDAQGHVWAIGGQAHPDIWDTVEIYDPGLNQWTSGPSMNEARCHHGAVRAPDGSIYVFGGRDSSAATNSVEKYDLNAAQWTYVASMNEARIAPSFALDSQGFIYAIGGASFPVQSPLATVERYNPSDPNAGWKYVASLPSAIGYGAAFEYDGEIWLVGGNSQSSYWSSACYIYSPDTDSWRSGPEMYEIVALAGAVVSQSGLPYLVGGERGGGSIASDHVSVLTPEPATLSLLAVGIGTLLVRRRRG